MDIAQVRCFLAVAEELHFGRAAKSLDMLPASLGRQIKILEDRYETRLFLRTTRSVSLTKAGSAILEQARKLVAQADLFEASMRNLRRNESNVLKVGAIDSAANGLMPHLMQLMRASENPIDIQLIEQKTIHLLPKVLSGGIDIAFCRPPEIRDPNIHFQTLFFETAVVALPDDHPLSGRSEVSIQDLADAPLIVPDRRSRPHSHDLTMKLFADAGLTARITQVADEKSTIVSLVAIGAGLAIVPRWVSRIAVPGVAFVPLALPDGSTRSKLILAAAWARGTRDGRRDALLSILEQNMPEIERTA